MRRAVVAFLVGGIALADLLGLAEARGDMAYQDVPLPPTAFQPVIAARPTPPIHVEPVETAEPSVAAPASPAPSASRSLSGSTLRGIASWYDARIAAAGPALRRVLGRYWRGHAVRVCVGSSCAATTLGDWCQCFKGTASERIIDLPRWLFARLADPVRGLIRVRVTF